MTITGLLETYEREPIRMVLGRGAALVDSAGKGYIDMLAGIAVASVGHCHPHVTEAIAVQAARLVHASNLFENQPMTDLAHRLHGLTMMDAFFCNSGAEAVETAIKLARRWGADNGKRSARIVAMEGGFHGRTMGALSATGQATKRAPFEPVVPGFTFVPYGDADRLREVLASDVAAVIVEPIQGEAGIVVPPPGYLAEVRRACDETGTLLILDEVQTGIGRTGAWFCYEHDCIAPDVLCLAKGLGGGVPIGACLATADVAASFRAGDHGCTFGGGPLVCAAALAVLDVIESEGLIARAASVGEALMTGLSDTLGGHAEVRGKGLMVGVGFQEPVAKEVSSRLREKGVIAGTCGTDVIRFTPPLVITTSEVDEAVERFGEVWQEMSVPAKL